MKSMEYSSISTSSFYHLFNPDPPFHNGLTTSSELRGIPICHRHQTYSKSTLSIMGISSTDVVPPFAWNKTPATHGLIGTP
jgi:hypothetical protein